MAGFDAMQAVMRELTNAAGSAPKAAELYERGVRTFEEAERAIATGLRGLPAPRREYVSSVSAPPEGERLTRKARG
jgi:hypothetical protein